VLEGMSVTLLRGKGTELAGEDTNIRVIDVAIVNVGREVAAFSLAHDIRHHAERVQVVALIELKRIALRYPRPGLDFLCDGSKFLWD